MQFNSTSNSVRTFPNSLKNNIWISQSIKMSSTEIIQSKTSENSRIAPENKLELETHHSETIFCDMISPDEWKSSLPLVFQQDDACLMSTSSTSPSNSIEDLVLELESSQELGSPFTEFHDNLLHKVSSAAKSEDLLCMVPGSSDMLCDDIMENEQDIENVNHQDKAELSIVAEETQPERVSDSDEVVCLEKNNESEIDTKRKRKFEGKTTTKKQRILETPSANKTTCAVLNDEQVEESPSVIPKNKADQKEKKSSSIQQLTHRLAEVVHCNNLDNVNVLQKATSTISTLRRQACDLMSTYSQLKFQNDELIQQQNQLQSGQQMEETVETQSKCPLIIEVLIPTAGSRKAFDSAPLYHHIPIEDGQIPTTSEVDLNLPDDIITEEPYEEEYDAQMYFNPALEETNQCESKKLQCELGCVCSSLIAGKLPVQHCKSPICMLEPECTRPEDPSHIPNPVKIINRRNSSDIETIDSDSTVSGRSKSSRSKRTKTQVAHGFVIRLDPKQVIDVQKLQRECFVRLVKLDTTTLKKKSVTNLHDPKLQSKCYVQLKRLQTSSNQSVYCMIHRQRGCVCLGSSS